MEADSWAFVDAVEELGEDLGPIGLAVVGGVLVLAVRIVTNWGPVS